MILDKKIMAKIDELDKIIYFYQEKQETCLNFDQQIHNFCFKVHELNEYIKKKLN